MSTKPRRIEIHKCQNNFYNQYATHSAPALVENGFTLIFLEGGTEIASHNFNAYNFDSVQKLIDWWINGKELLP